MTATAPRNDPWIETRQGTLFFVNALLVAPALIVLYPLAVKGLLGAMGLRMGDPRFLDTFPALASVVVPWVGWLAIAPFWLTLRNLRMERLWVPRFVLGLFALIHLGVLGYTIWAWITGGGA